MQENFCAKKCKVSVTVAQTFDSAKKSLRCVETSALTAMEVRANNSVGALKTQLKVACCKTNVAMARVTELTALRCATGLLHR